MSPIVKREPEDDVDERSDIKRETLMVKREPEEDEGAIAPLKQEVKREAHAPNLKQETKRTAKEEDDVRGIGGHNEEYSMVKRETKEEDNDGDTASNRKPELMSEEGTKPVAPLRRLEMEVPKRMFTGDARLLSNTEFQLQVVRGKLSSHLESADSDTYTLKARGTKEELEILKQKTLKWVENKEKILKLHRLVFDPESYELDLILDSTETLGATLFAPQRDAYGFESKGFWVEHSHRDGQLRKVFERARGGMALLKINGSKILRDARDIEEAITRAREVGTAMTVCVCVDKSTDISELKTSKIKFSKDGEPRRRGAKRSVQKKAELFKKINEYAIEEENGTCQNDETISSIPRPSNSREHRLALQAIFEDQNSIVLDLFVDISSPLGTTIYENKRKSGSDNIQGLWVESFEKGAQLREILGPVACAYGAVLLAIDGKPIYSQSQIHKLKQSGATQVSLRMLFRDGSDLWGATNLVPSTALLANPRRKDGRPCLLRRSRPNKFEMRKKRKPNPSAAQAATNLPISTAESPVARIPERKRSPSPENFDPHRTKREKKRRRQEENQLPPTQGSQPPANDEPGKPAADRKESRENFKSKFAFAIKYEYVTLGIKTAEKHLWREHEKLFGKDAMCDDDCECLYRLPDLAESVNKHFLRNDESWSPTINVGFFLFSKRFLPKLDREYPSESSFQLMSRLYAMWRRHRANTAFGLRCTKSCTCAIGWEEVFKKGDVEKHDLNRKPMAKHGGASLARKPANTGCLSRNSQVSYTVTWKRNESLGIFFVTSEEGGKSKCKVYSLFNWEELKKRESLLRPGTIVESVLVGFNNKKVEKVEDLRSYCRDLRMKRKDITLSFINTEVEQITRKIELRMAKDWTPKGHWREPRIRGWAGGAPYHQNKEKPPKAKKRKENQEAGVPRGQVGPSRDQEIQCTSTSADADSVVKKIKWPSTKSV